MLTRALPPFTLAPPVNAAPTPVELFARLDEERRGPGVVGGDFAERWYAALRALRGGRATA